MKPTYPPRVAVRTKGESMPRLYCEVVSCTKRQGFRLHVLNGGWEGLLRGTTLTILPSKERVENQELLDVSNLPKHERKDYNQAMAYVAAHPEDFPVIPAPVVRPPEPRLSHDEQIYKLFYAAPNKVDWLADHILAENLKVPVPDLIAALERHGFTTEPVTHEGHAYLKLSRPDGKDFAFDWNHITSNFYDGKNAETGEVAELRTLPYTLQEHGAFLAIWWVRAPVPGELPPPRITRAWPLMDSTGQNDVSPTIKEIRAEKAEKERVKGLDAENAKLREELAKAWTLDEILKAFGEAQTWDSLHDSFSSYMTDVLAAMHRQKGIPEPSTRECKDMLNAAEDAAWRALGIEPLT